MVVVEEEAAPRTAAKHRWTVGVSQTGEFNAAPFLRACRLNTSQLEISGARESRAPGVNPLGRGAQ